LAQDPDNGSDVIPAVRGGVRADVSPDSRGVIIHDGRGSVLGQALSRDCNQGSAIVAGLTRPMLASDKPTSTVRSDPQCFCEVVVRKPPGFGVSHDVRPHARDGVRAAIGHDAGEDVTMRLARLTN
jgi:hypothetical protein